MESKLKDRFEEFGSEPTNDLWDRISNTLDEKNRRKPVFIWIFRSLAGIFILGFLALGIFNKESEKISQNTNESYQRHSKSDVNSVNANEVNKQKKEEKTDDKSSTNSSSLNSNSTISYSDKEIRTSRQKTNNLISIPSSTINEKVVEKNYDIEIIPEVNNTTIVTLDLKKDSIFVNDKHVLSELSPIKSDSLSDATKFKKPSKRFEIGLSYSYYLGQIRDYSSIQNSSFENYSDVSSFPNNPDTQPISNANYYRIAAPLNVHVHFSLFLNNKFRLDSELGYSRFTAYYLDSSKTVISTMPVIQSVSIPLGISFNQQIRSSNHYLQVGIGIVNDLSPKNWNQSNSFYYALSTQARVGYSYYIGKNENWKMFTNLSWRYSFYEQQKHSLINKRNLFGMQFGFARCF